LPVSVKDKVIASEAGRNCFSDPIKLELDIAVFPF
jgi:hypothetical protein